MNREWRTFSAATQPVAEVVRLLGLEPLPREGGYFRRIAESEERVAGVKRRQSATILFLLGSGDFSALHRLDAKETWRHEAGDGLELWLLGPGAAAEVRRLDGVESGGSVVEQQVPAGVWQGARVVTGGRWALVSCVTEPEFEWEGFELGERKGLQAGWPALAAEISMLTR